jgi:hypothetical protein
MAYEHSRKSSDEPATLHDVMKDALADELQARYHPPEVLPHNLLVRLMQMQEDERRKAAS